MRKFLPLIQQEEEGVANDPLVSCEEPSSEARQRSLFSFPWSINCDVMMEIKMCYFNFSLVEIDRFFFMRMVNGSENFHVVVLISARTFEGF